MQQIQLCGARWENPGDFYTALKSSLGAPAWHGQNLDAFWDSITSGDINRVNPPFRIQITDTAEMPQSCRDLVDRLVLLIAEAATEGHQVEIICEC